LENTINYLTGRSDGWRIQSEKDGVLKNRDGIHVISINQSPTTTTFSPFLFSNGEGELELKISNYDRAMSLYRGGMSLSEIEKTIKKG